jgi:hypothetical protein
MEQWLFDKDISSRQLFVVDRLPVQKRRAPPKRRLPFTYEEADLYPSVRSCDCQLSCRVRPAIAAAARNPAALLVEHNCPAIDDHQRRPERSGSLLDGRKPMCPIMAAPGEDPDTLGFDMNGEALAIPFHLPISQKA